MKNLKIIIWTGFLVLLLVFSYYEYYFLNAKLSSIICFEFANANKGKEILSQWNSAGLLSVAKWMTWLDFVYIFCYVGIIIIFSNTQIRKEPSIGLNALLRANFFFAFLAGFLDVIENISLLYNIQSREASYLSLAWITWLKFILIGWTILVWLISFVKSKIKR
jgi:hypothetical protein